MATNKDLAVQLWISHNQFLWQQVRAIPFVEAVILAGGYKLRTDNELGFAIAVLAAGVFMFVLIALMMNRHRQHVKTFREAAGDAIPDPGIPLLCLRSDWIAVSIPLLLALLNGVAIVIFLCKGT